MKALQDRLAAVEELIAHKQSETSSGDASVDAASVDAASVDASVDAASVDAASVVDGLQNWSYSDLDDVMV